METYLRVGEKTAMNFFIETGGDIKQFESHKKLIAMAGLDPALYQSGKVDREGMISRHLMVCFLTHLGFSGLLSERSCGLGEVNVVSKQIFQLKEA